MKGKLSTEGGILELSLRETLSVKVISCLLFQSYILLACILVNSIARCFYPVLCVPVNRELVIILYCLSTIQHPFLWWIVSFLVYVWKIFKNKLPCKTEEWSHLLDQTVCQWQQTGCCQLPRIWRQIADVLWWPAPYQNLPLKGMHSWRTTLPGLNNQHE